MVSGAARQRTPTRSGRRRPAPAADGPRPKTAVDGGQVLALDGSASRVRRAFGTTLRTLTFAGGRRGIGPGTTATMPAAVSKLVAGVTGLTEVGALHTQARSAVSFPASYTPQQISSIYGAGSTYTGSGVPVAVIASGPLGQVKTGTWAQQNLTRQASFSAGECEILAQVTGLQSSLDTVLRQAAAQGQSLFTSSGDTRAQSAHGGTLGFANAILYTLPASTFQDITVGTNGLFPATPDYDYTTGRGTPIVGLLSARA